MSLLDALRKALFKDPAKYGPPPQGLERTLKHLRDEVMGGEPKPVLPHGSGFTIPAKPKPARFTFVEAECDTEPEAVELAQVLMRRYKCEIKIWYENCDGEVRCKVAKPFAGPTPHGR